MLQRFYLDGFSTCMEWITVINFEVLLERMNSKCHYFLVKKSKCLYFLQDKHIPAMIVATSHKLKYIFVEM